MYGGSGTWPMRRRPRRRRRRLGPQANRPPAVEPPLEDLCVQLCEPSASRRARAKPGSRSITCPPGFNFWPGVHQRFPVLVVGSAESAGIRRRRRSGTRWPSSRAGNTRVLLTTRRSPGAGSRRSCAKRLCAMAPVSRSRASSRAALAVGGRLLGDQLSGQLEVEIGDVHPEQS